jgi:hypothetical protein
MSRGRPVEARQIFWLALAASAAIGALEFAAQQPEAWRSAHALSLGESWPWNPGGDFRGFLSAWAGNLESIRACGVNSIETLKNCPAAQQVIAQVPASFSSGAGSGPWLAAVTGGSSVLVFYVVRATLNS